MRGRVNKPAQSNPLDWKRYPQSHVRKELPEALALNRTRAPGLRLPSPMEIARLSEFGAKLPTMHAFREYVESAGLMSYSSNKRRENAAAGQIRDVPSSFTAFAVRGRRIVNDNNALIVPGA